MSTWLRERGRYAKRRRRRSKGEKGEKSERKSDTLCAIGRKDARISTNCTMGNSLTLLFFAAAPRTALSHLVHYTVYYTFRLPHLCVNRERFVAFHSNHPHAHTQCLEDAIVCNTQRVKLDVPTPIVAALLGSCHGSRRVRTRMVDHQGVRRERRRAMHTNTKDWQAFQEEGAKT